jgi:putative FmdB family regulatory protein
MPIYEFQCQSCNRIVERLSTTLEENEELTYINECPFCNNKMRRIISVPFFHIRGKYKKEELREKENHRIKSNIKERDSYMKEEPITEED